MQIQIPLKIVVTITTNKSETTAKNLCTNTIIPKLTTLCQTKFGLDITGLVIESKVQAIKTGNRMQVYPKIIFSGNTSLTETEFNTKIDELLDQFKVSISADIIAFGGINLIWHIHKTTGTVT